MATEPGSSAPPVPTATAGHSPITVSSAANHTADAGTPLAGTPDLASSQPSDNTRITQHVQNTPTTVQSLPPAPISVSQQNAIPQTSTAAHSSSQPSTAALPQAPLTHSTTANQHTPTSATAPHTTAPPSGSQQNASQPSTRASPEHWLAHELKPWFLASVLGTTIGFMATIIALTAVSARENGITTISQLTIHNFVFGYKLAWTFFPVAVFTVYVTVFKSVIDAAAVRQPYVELWEKRQIGSVAQSANQQIKGASLKRSLLLDYSSHNQFTKPFVALRRGHYFLAIAFALTASVIAIGLPSLASHLLDTNIILTSEEVEAIQDSHFNGAGLTFRDSLVPILDTVAAVQIYGGAPPAWTTSRYNIQNFSVPRLAQYDTSSSGGANFSMSTKAYSASLACNILNGSEYQLLIEDSNTGLRPNLRASDRGCSIDGIFAVAGKGFQYTRTYLQTLSITCDYSDGFSRIVVFAAANLNESLTHVSNVTVISCIPTYHVSTGILKLDQAGSADLRVYNFTANSTSTITDPQPQSAPLFESLLNQAYTFDSTDTTSSTDFGSLILQDVQHRSQAHFLDPLLLNESTTILFAAIFALTAREFLVRSIDPVVKQGLLSAYRTRLVIVLPVACIMLGILTVGCAIIAYAAFYVQRHESTLYEEPRGLLGAAGILLDSDVLPLLRDLRAQDPRNAMHLCEAFEMDSHLKTKGWYVEDWHEPERSRIRETEQARKPDTRV